MKKTDTGSKERKVIRTKHKDNKKVGSPSGKKHGGPQPPKHIIAGLGLWIVLFVTLFIFLLFQRGTGVKTSELPYSAFMSHVNSGEVRSVTIAGKEIRGEFISSVNIDGEATNHFRSFMPFEDTDLVNNLVDRGIKVEGRSFFSIWGRIAPHIFLFAFIILFWVFLLRKAGRIPADALKFGQSKARQFVAVEKVTFNDVAGVEEAKDELKEVVEFLKSPKKFERLGAKIPKGVLLVGAPGTGKTLLAKATAGEAKVPFFSLSGSDFVEMFVGVGASRVRDLFSKSKTSAPCIVFIDELDAVGRHRGAGIGSGHDEREQTLNALLVEMDGFETNKGIIIMAATNRPDVLDPALLRPGRFDRRIVVDRPDLKGREEIFKVHTKVIPLNKDVNLEILARGTAGFSGADIANMSNEAALIAAKKGRSQVEHKDFEEARDKVLMGVERKSLIIPEKERETIAYHEAGHVLVAKFLPEADPIHKVTIIPRGMALGVTQHLPVDERRNYSREYCFAHISVLYGGRVTEQLVLNTMTTGAKNDIEQATELTHKMVCEWGMSDNIGPIALGKKQEEIFLGRELTQRRDFSEETARLIDSEVKKIIKQCEDTAREIISSHIKILHKIVDNLLKKEVLTGVEIDDILKTMSLPTHKKKKRTAIK